MPRDALCILQKVKCPLLCFLCLQVAALTWDIIWNPRRPIPGRVKDIHFSRLCIELWQCLEYTHPAAVLFSPICVQIFGTNPAVT
ncbi:uncharacterized protein BJ212DRAFT_820736 [Suillus subaureus]|uniref:Uncharacterized protein n=1 Tax=Suillus subaureus TaxID=48587 RepID=A0A9P7JHI5_9AGAM|nr:uncharacterized protein BJ212DRAFT_820736 [Suillus subaureus]KAG1822673.1 hypothetical protein BJ212DRAFT_820736 [Suillus subaureus]